MKDIKTKEVTTKPKTKNPASRIPKELMRTATNAGSSVLFYAGEKKN